MTRKLSLQLLSHWPELSHVAPASCKGTWEMFSLSGKQFAKLILQVSWRVARKLAEPSLSTWNSVSHGMNAHQMIFSLNHLEGD